jgi:hypothetical protein
MDEVWGELSKGCEADEQCEDDFHFQGANFIIYGLFINNIMHVPKYDGFKVGFL